MGRRLKGTQNIFEQQRSRPDCASALSVQGILSSATQCWDPVEDIGLITKILTRRVAVQTGLALRHPCML